MLGGAENVHFSVEWKRKLPQPTTRYPTKEMRKTESWPFRMQFDMPLKARYMNMRLVKALTTSAEYTVA